MQSDQPQTPSAIQSETSSNEEISSPPEMTTIPPVQTETLKKSSPVRTILIVVALVGLLSGIGYFSYQNNLFGQQTASSDTPQETPNTTPPSDPTAGWVERKFEGLKLTFKAPAELTLEEPEATSEQIVGYIQNDKIGQEFFQMYFVYQKSGKLVKESDIPTLKNDPKFIVPGTERDVEIDNHPGFSGQVTDKSKRFITAIVKDGYWLIIYTAEPNQTNKELSDRIMSTFKFTD